MVGLGIWVAHVLSLAGSATRAVAETVEDPTSSPGSNPAAAQQLQVRIAEGLQYGLEGSQRRAGEVLFEGGQALAPFSCLGDSEQRAVDDESVSVRKLKILRQEHQAAASLLDGIRPGWTTGGEPVVEEELSVANARLRVMVEGRSETTTPTLTASLSPELPNTTGAVLQSAASATDISVEYDCWREGRAVVELRLSVLGPSLKALGEVCLQWTKRCALGWRNLEISEGSRTVLSNGAVNMDWEAEMKNEGTHESATKFQLSSPGIERLRRPSVFSTNALLEVAIRGEFVDFADAPEPFFEITSQSMTISVIYKCQWDGPADVVMTLEKAVLSEAHRPEQMQLKWRKVCGATTFRHLQIFLKRESDSGRNTTQAVRDGLVQPGFMRPCPKSRRPGGFGSSTSLSPAAECEEGLLAFEVSDKERRTSLELQVAKEAMEPPLQPPPDLSYNRSIMQATLVQLPRSAGSSKQALRKHVQTLNVKYTCFKDGESVVMVTLHVLAHKHIDLAWRKRCSEPKVRVGKALTAPQALLITGIVSSIVALVCCLIFYFCGQDKGALLDYDGVPNGAGGARDIEIAGRRLGGTSRFGKGFEDMDPTEEVITYH